MGMQLPGELIGLLGMLGYTWPEGDETKLMEMGGTWISFGGGLQSASADADAVAQGVWTANKGDDFEAFQKEWTDDEAASANIRDAGTDCMLVGAGMLIAGIIILALKINVIVQLIILAIQIAQAIATAVVTFGASLLEIPIFKMITGLIIDQLIGMAVEALLNG
ncbi:WXG100-like domain-containing protein [Actinomadura sp. 3N407]|uniref:WXG100-like domain-containing protein n=1 Tax=Actinomadura sp. 3N407 TaxID=3457423 RepID=UPI003FCCA981